MQEEVRDFAGRAARLRGDKRLDEAVLAARKAISIDADHPNAWWQLALALRDKDGIAAATQALSRVVELAPDFADGWCEYGFARQQVGDIDEAIELYEAALNADSQHTRTLRLLGHALAQRENDPDAKRRHLELLRTLQTVSVLLTEEQFTLAYLLVEQREFLEAARAYEAYTRDVGGQAAFYNLALTYASLGRDCDALDSYRTAHFNGFDPARTTERINAHLKAMLPLRHRVLSSRNPYLGSEDWYQHYINPFMLLNVEHPVDVFDDPRAMQKAKQVVFREIELEEGKVEWMPGLVIDKSTAMSLFETLNDMNYFQAHHTVWENKPLCEFLSRGNLEHFLAQGTVTENPVLPHLVEAETLQIVGPSFAAQYNLVLTKAIEQGEVDIVECLLDGRRWVALEHEERCFEGAKRALTRICEPLLKLQEDAEERTVTRAEIERTLARNKLGPLLVHLPSEFHETHARVGLALRELSVNFYNRETNAEEAKAIIELGRVCATKSPALSHQLEEDLKFLEEAIKKERADEAHLQFGQTKFAITKEGVIHGGKRLAPKDIGAVRWGLLQTAVNPETLHFVLAFKAKHGHDIDVSWTASSGLSEQKELWGKVVDATMTYILAGVLANFESRLQEGRTERVGGVDVVQSGVVFDVQGWFSTKRVHSAWRNLTSELVNGAVVIRDVTNSKAAAALPMHSVDNAFLLHVMCSRKDKR